MIVLDHHTAEARLPRALAVVNPNRLDQAPGLGQLAACGVTFLTLVAINRALRHRKAMPDGREPDLLALLDLVALGTVCDVVPLTGVNRALVTQGLKVARRRGNAGLRALADTSRVAERLDAWHLGFLLGPRINAAGRIGRAELGAQLLATDDEREALQLATMLEGHNDDRKEIEAAVLADATARIEAAGAAGPVIVTAGEGWHPGVIGIVAGRLKERYNRPVCVVALEGGIGKASPAARSRRSIWAARVIEARRAGFIDRRGWPPHGGRLHRCGREAARSDGFPGRPCGCPDRWSAGSGAGARRRAGGRMAPGWSWRRDAGAAGSLGARGNPEPKFAIAGARLVRADVVGDGHVRCVLAGADGGRLTGDRLPAASASPLGDALLARSGMPLHPRRTAAGQPLAGPRGGRSSASTTPARRPADRPPPGPPPAPPAPGSEAL